MANESIDHKLNISVKTGSLAPTEIRGNQNTAEIVIRDYYTTKEGKIITSFSLNREDIEDLARILNRYLDICSTYRTNLINFDPLPNTSN